MVGRRARSPDVADLTLVALPDPRIDTSPNARAKVGLTPGTAGPLVGWGLRTRAGRGWYLDVPEAGTPVVVRVLEGTHHPSGQPAPPPPGTELSAVFFRGPGEPEAGRIVADDLTRLVAIPEEDGEFLARRLSSRDGRSAPDRSAPGGRGSRSEHPLAPPGGGGEPDHRQGRAAAGPESGSGSGSGSGSDGAEGWPPDPTELRRDPVGAAGSDPIFLVGAFVCAPAADTTHAPVHEGQLGPHRVAALRTAREGYDLVLDVAALLVEAPGPWGGPVAEVAGRAADVLQARYPRLVARVATGALSQTVDEADLPVMPDVDSGDAQLDRLLASLWAAWAFGPRATTARGRELVRAARPADPAGEVDRLLVRLLVTLHLAAKVAARSRRD